ncbi:hypothetical protein AB0J80_38025 [Actinoplanes sp. NPDC049548]|uniref:hypothetical protein n=1 Tax=Actinoplanes sp. NPDC049548 TaxID=3155152 RepID=UPI00342B0459
MRHLAGEPEPGARFDMQRAITVGRRRRRNRRVTAVVTAVAAAVVAVTGISTGLAALPRHPDRGLAARPSPATVPDGCVASLLPLAPGHSARTEVTGADPSGRWTVGRTAVPNADINYLPLIWDGSTLQPTTEPPGFNAELHDINGSGVAVGEAVGEAADADRNPQPYAWVGHAWVRLRGVTAGRAMAVNDAGVIVGYALDNDGQHPVLWRSATAEPVRLPMPAGFLTGQAVNVDDDGTVVGELVGADTIRPYTWSSLTAPGELAPLPKIDGKPAYSFEVTDARGDWILGAVQPTGQDEDNDVRIPFRYRRSNHTFEQLGRDGQPIVYRGINTAGWAVGAEPAGAFVRSQGKVVRLPSTGLGEYPPIPRTISDDGHTIVGSLKSGPPVIWRC